MKILYCTDLHLKARPPRRRTDDYLATSLAKVDWVCRTALAEGCESIIFGGDLLDSPVQPYSVLVPFIEVVARHGVLWRYVVGNHDVPGGNIAASVRSAIGAIHYVDRFFKRISPGGKIGNGSVRLWPFDFEPGIDSRKKYMIENDMEEDGRCISIVVAHAMVVDKQEAVFEHVRAADIETNADLFLCSHYHPGFAPVEHGSCLFVAPGAMTRSKVTDAERIPQVAIVEIGGGSIDVRHVEIPHRPAVEVFDMAAVERDKSWQTGIDAFIGAAAGVKISRGDVPTRAKAFAEEQGFDEEILAVFLERVAAYPGGKP